MANSPGPVTTVSAADYEGPVVAPESIVSGFGQNLAQGSEGATTIPLPTELSGTSIRVTDSMGVERLAPLFASSPNQFNFHIPLETALGQAVLTLYRGDVIVATGSVFVDVVAPGLFSANAQRFGSRCGYISPGSADNSRTSGLTYDPNTMTTAPIDVAVQGEQV